MKKTTWVELFAQMANSDPTKTPTTQRRSMLRAWCRLAPAPISSAYSDQRNYEAVVDSFFDRIHRSAWHWIRDLLRGEVVIPDADVFVGTFWRLEDDGRQLVEDTPRADEQVLGELVATLRARPFPLRFCPVCETVFPRDGKQAYCSTQCSQRKRNSDRLTPGYRRSKRLQMRKYRKRKAAAK